MNTSAKVCCVFMLLLALTTGVLLSTCGESNFNETLRKEEYGFVNISYTVNITRSSNLLGIFHITYEVCEKNLKKLSCSLRWENSMDRKDISRTTGLICYGEERNLSHSEVALSLHISQLVTRSLSVMMISSSTDRISTPKRLIRLEVLYQPSITSMTVDGREVNDNYVIEEGHKVDVSCAFETGNPPVILQLLNQHNSVLTSSGNQGHFSYSLTARCEDEWPIIRCQGSGSTRNRSVTFLVKCPPHFVDSSVKFVSIQIFEAITFRVKAHSVALTGCVLTPVALGNKIRRGVSCILSGNPPDLFLSVYLYKETDISQGNWSLILHNEKGSANTTLCIINVPNPGIQKMGCHIKNPRNPYEIQCPSTPNFTLYFHSFSGQQVLIADCVYKEKRNCFFIREGFNMTIDDGNVPTITVPETNWKQVGRFICQSGGLPLNVSCPFPPPGIPKLGCHIQNLKNPYTIQCSFPESTQDFSYYFHSINGQQDLIANCAYKEKPECFFIREGFNMTIGDGNLPTIAVPDTTWTLPGRFICQSRGQPLNVSCPFPSPGIPKEGCHIRNLTNPYKIQCLFLNPTQDFSLYFHSFIGQQALIAYCVYKEKPECFFIREGFNMTLDVGNIPTLAVPDTIWKQSGRFICQSRGLPLNDSCPFPPPKNLTSGSSTTSEGGLNTAENSTLNNSSTSKVSSNMPGYGFDTSLEPKHFENGDHHPINIGAAVGAGLPGILLLFLVIGVLLWKKYKSIYSPERPEQSEIDGVKYRDELFLWSPQDIREELEYLREHGDSDD